MQREACIRTFAPVDTPALPTTAPADAIPSAAAVVLNYRTPEQTAVAVEMLRRSNARLTPLIVVDNGNGADCGAALASVRRRGKRFVRPAAILASPEDATSASAMRSRQRRRQCCW